MKECSRKGGKERYAVKIIRSDDEEMFIHMEREFKILEKLNGHPNIIHSIEYVPEKEKCRGYLVIEKAKGVHLLDHIMEEGAFEEDTAKGIFKTIMESLAYMHEKKVVHRDFNPTNILLTCDNDVKILDFNVSKSIENPDQIVDEDGRFKFSLFTKTGTPIYTAPEIHLSGLNRYSEAIDLWGAGTVLYLLLSGSRPFNDTE